MIFIKGNVPSSKNSKEICWNKNMKRPILTNSKTVKNYLKAHEYEWENPKTIKEFKKKLEGKENLTGLDSISSGTAEESLTLSTPHNYHVT